MKWFLQRMQEPSSQAGLGMVAAGIAHASSSKDYSTAAGMILGGLFAFISKEGQPSQPEQATK